MESIFFKRKEYQIEEKLGQNTYKVSLKGKPFVLKVFDLDTLDFSTFIRQSKRLKVSGVKIPKILKVDKKEGKVLIEFVEGERVIDTLAKEDLGELYLKSIFEISWFAENEKITLDYHPDNFIMTPKGELIYARYDYQDGLDQKRLFKTTSVKYWFFTKEFVKYAQSKNIQVDLSRLKEEYVINKEICLAVVKYYI